MRSKRYFVSMEMLQSLYLSNYKNLLKMALVCAIIPSLILYAGKTKRMKRILIHQCNVTAIL
ncbi:hypothetical protein V1478_007094 [Vespula squamosa]|uniref:Uncharacterized protein n=1 Tax=Vespula squamosa TaxID=30214 RepID=A0ABD2B2B1_VESSQ